MSISSQFILLYLLVQSDCHYLKWKKIFKGSKLLHLSCTSSQKMSNVMLWKCRCDIMFFCEVTVPNSSTIYFIVFYFILFKNLFMNQAKNLYFFCIRIGITILYFNSWWLHLRNWRRQIFVSRLRVASPEKLYLPTSNPWDHPGRDRMVVRFTHTYAISAYHH